MSERIEYHGFIGQIRWFDLPGRKPGEPELMHCSPYGVLFKAPDIVQPSANEDHGRFDSA